MKISIPGCLIVLFLSSCILKCSSPMRKTTQASTPNDYPAFPFPPPKASTFEVIPKTFLEKSNEKVSIDFLISNKLLPALKDAGYEYSFYLIKDSGIAIVTRLEKINSDGTPEANGDRYLTGTQSQHFGMLDYIKSLFIAKPGYYRVIVFMISPYFIVQSNSEITKAQADSLFTAGADRPLERIISYEFSDRYECTALIYQFVKPNEEDPAKELQPSQLTCQTHLEKAGIWMNLSK